MSLNLLVDENIPGVERYLAPLGDVRLVAGRAITQTELADVDALLVRSVTPVTRKLLEGSPVRFVGSATSGTDHVDRAYLEEAGIAFAHAPGSNANSVVEYVLSAIAAVRDKLECLCDGGTVGIVGYGNVGRALASRLGALDIGYRVYDPWLAEGTVPSAQGLEDVLACDVVSLHAELTDEKPWPSRNLIGAAELQHIQAGALLINCSRGPVIDSSALSIHLAENRDLLTALDVWDPEPDIPTGLLQQVTLGTAHIAGYSLDGKLAATRMMRGALENHFGSSIGTGTETPDQPPPIRIEGRLSHPELIRFLIHERYDVREDDARLRTAVLDPSANTGKSFDRLRKTYPERRELAGTAVQGVEPGRQQVLVQALGCTLQGVCSE